MADVLKLVAGVRAATAGRQRLEYVDLVVNGVPLSVAVGPAAGDLVPVLVTNWPGGSPVDALRCLLGEVASPLPDGRVPLLVCAECGDLGCGAITAVVEHDSAAVTWRAFGYQNDYSPYDEVDAIRGLGPFVFDRPAYRTVLDRLRR